MYLELFRDLLSFVEIEDSRLFIRISTDGYQEISIDEKLFPSIDGEATRELMTKLEDFKFHKSFNNYILSPWPPVRLYY